MPEAPEIFDSVQELGEESSIQQASTSNPSHELGETVARTMSVDTPMQQEDSLLSQVPGAPTLLHADVDKIDAEDAISFEVTAPIIRSVQRSKATQVTSNSTHGNAGVPPTNLPRKRKRKAQPLDEIDTIFG
jgi:hypothetical protein